MTLPKGKWLCPVSTSVELESWKLLDGTNHPCTVCLIDLSRRRLPTAFGVPFLARMTYCLSYA
jgi:hypothetical protein